MSLLKTALNIAAAVGGGYIASTGAGSDLFSGIKNDTTKKLAQSFLIATGKGGEGADSRPFASAPEVRPRSVSELTRLSPSTAPANLQPVQQMLAANPRLETAVANLSQSATNAQVQELFAMYSQQQSPTLRQGRKTISIEQPGNIQVT